VGEEETSVREIAEAVRVAVGDVSIVHTEGRAADFAGAHVSGDRAAAELGWRPRTTFTEGVGRYVAWHQAHAAAQEQGAGAPATSENAPSLVRRRGVTARRHPAALRRLAPYAQSVISGVLALVVYAFVLHAAGLLAGEENTVLVVAVLTVAATVTTRSTQARVAVWLTALAGAALLIPPQPTGILDMARLTLPLLALALGGAGFVLVAAASGRRLTLELAEQRE
jgi:hypothetical protein